MAGIHAQDTTRTRQTAPTTKTLLRDVLSASRGFERRLGLLQFGQGRGDVLTFALERAHLGGRGDDVRNQRLLGGALLRRRQRLGLAHGGKGID